jgi:N utilization substance protein B
MTRREAREAVFSLLFETEFRSDEETAEIFATSCEERELIPDDYIKNTYYGIQEHKGELDEKIAAHARGWKTERLTRVSRSILRLAVYEMLYCKEIPASVSLNEAIELAKKFEDEKARPFINGVLNSIKTETEEA